MLDEPANVLGANPVLLALADVVKSLVDKEVLNSGRLFRFLNLAAAAAEDRNPRLYSDLPRVSKTIIFLINISYCLSRHVVIKSRKETYS